MLQTESPVIGLLVPDSIGVRNFVLGSFLRQLGEVGQVHVFHALEPEILPDYAPYADDRTQWHAMPEFSDHRAWYLLRQSLTFAHMYWVDTPPLRYVRNRPIRGWKSRAAMAVTRAVGRACATPARLSRLESLHSAIVGRSPQVARFKRVLEELRPSVLFSSHQRPLRMVPAVLAARQLGIPTAAFIFSWDNLTTKGRIATPFDHYLVWSELMRRELLQYYPEIPRERTHVVGTPQFDPYADPALIWPREAFFRRIGADPGRPLICYSGGDTENSAADPDHVRALLELVRAGRVRRQPQVMLRPCPVDDGTRFAAVRRDFPEMIYAPPAWTASRCGWTNVVPSAEDLQFLANLVRHCDVNVNFSSTMTLDFAIHDKPVVNVAFDASHPPRFRMPMWEYVCQFPHYQPVMDLGASRFAHSAEELAAQVNAYLDDPALDREGRQRFVALEVGTPVGQSGARIVDVLQEIAGRGSLATVGSGGPSVR
jgi:hypothetical protein